MDDKYKELQESFNDLVKSFVILQDEVSSLSVQMLRLSTELDRYKTNSNYETNLWCENTTWTDN